jgi:hypothetical protein
VSRCAFETHGMLNLGDVVLIAISSAHAAHNHARRLAERLVATDPDR